jgi:hypothetical protein
VGTPALIVDELLRAASVRSSDDHPSKRFGG